MSAVNSMVFQNTMENDEEHSFQSFNSFVSQFKTKKDEYFNFQVMPGNGVDKASKLNVPPDKELEFWTSYYNMKVKENQPSSLLEKPLKDFNQIKIDIDFKQDMNVDNAQMATSGINDNVEHQYEISSIVKLIDLYYKTILKYIDVPNNSVNFTIFEKDKPKVKNLTKNTYIKDGVHIMCPDIVLPNVILYAIYDDFINNDNVKKVYTEFQNKEPIDKCIDKCVIATNAWFPIGSGKPTDELDYYKPTHTYKMVAKPNGNSVSNDFTVKHKEIDLDLKEVDLIMRFSNYKKKVNCTLKPSVNISELEKKFISSYKSNQELTTVEIKKLQLNIPQHHNNKKPLDMNYITQLMKCLSKNRVDDYDLWYKVGICLYNISPWLFNLFNQWSKSSAKYNESDVYRYWYTNFTKNCSKYNLGLSQLKQYAKQDNEALYYNVNNVAQTRFLDNWISQILEHSNGKTNKIGQIDVCKQLKRYIELHCEWQLKCADNTSNHWYKFEGQQWYEDKGANKLYYLFTNDLINMLRKRFEFYNDKIKEIKTNISTLNNASINAGVMALDSINSNSDANPFDTSNNNNMDNTSSGITDTNSLITEQKIYEAKSKITESLIDFIQASSNRNNLIKDLSQECYDKDFYKTLDINPNVFLCTNCVLDLEQGIIRNGQPEDMTTICCGYDFPMDINNHEAQEIIIEIEEFLDKIFPDEDVQNYALNLLAECLAGHIRREEFYIHTGSGSNGKSVLSDLVKEVFGDYYYAPDNTIFNTPKKDPNAPNPIMAGARGKRYIMASEPKQSKGLQSDVIKQLTGGDMITGRNLNKDPIHFKPMAKWNMGCNDIPGIDSTDGGIWRRVCVIPYVSKFVDPECQTLNNKKRFPYHFPKDESVKEKLATWRPYLLFMLWQRYLNLKRNNFTLLSVNRRPDAVSRATQEYKKSSNIYEQYYMEKLESKTGYRVNINEVYNDFRDYVKENSMDKPVSKKEFETHIKRFVDIKGTARKRYIMDYIIIDTDGETY